MITINRKAFMFTVYDKFGDEEICASHTWIATTLCDFCDQVLTRFASPVIEDGLDFIHALYNDAEREAQICLKNIPYLVHVKADKTYNDVDKEIIPKIINREDTSQSIQVQIVTCTAPLVSLTIKTNCCYMFEYGNTKTDFCNGYGWLQDNFRLKTVSAVLGKVYPYGISTVNM